MKALFGPIKEVTLRSAFFAFLSLILVSVVCLQYPIQQDINYHYFADTRTFFGVNNFLNVFSGLLFLPSGLIGMYYTASSSTVFAHKGEKMFWAIAFISASCISLGSLYYHLSPNNYTLVWDRLPMTLCFISLFSAIFVEKVNPSFGIIGGFVMLFLAICSIIYWAFTEFFSIGDLRPYLAIQFIAIFLFPFIIFSKGSYSCRQFLFLGFGMYFISKFFEHFDHEIYLGTRKMFSGHTLRHICAALSVFIAALYLKNRRVRSE